MVSASLRVIDALWPKVASADFSSRINLVPISLGTAGQGGEHRANTMQRDWGHHGGSLKRVPLLYRQLGDGSAAAAGKKFIYLGSQVYLLRGLAWNINWRYHVGGTG